MRTKAPMLFVAAVLVVGLAWQLSGINAVLTDNPSANPADGVPASELEDTAEDYNPEEGIEGQAPGSDAGNLVGIAISAGQSIADLFAMALMLPVVLDNGGLPYYWAYPLGLLAQIVSFIGVAQFVSNRQVV